MNGDKKEWPTERITKLDAARRQLSVAIRLLLEDKDMLAVHTLVGAAHAVLERIALGGKSRNTRKKLKDNIFVRNDCRLAFTRHVNEARNFLKHADRDSGDTHEFNPNNTAYWLCDAVWMLHQATGRWGKEGTVFIGWFMLAHPDVLDPLALPSGGIDILIKMKIKISAPEIKKSYLELLEHQTFWKE